MRIHGESSPQPGGCHESRSVRNTRSGCGMRMVKRPSGVVSAVTPSAEPFGLYGYASVTAPRLSTKRAATRSLQASIAAAFLNTARPSPCAVTIGMRLPSMPLKRIDDDFWISTSATRASYCSEAFLSKCGQLPAPGMMSFRLDIIWQPLHAPSAKRSEEHTSELQSLTNLVCRLLLEKKKKKLSSSRSEDSKIDQNACDHRIRCCLDA